MYVYIYCTPVVVLFILFTNCDPCESERNHMLQRATRFYALM